MHLIINSLDTRGWMSDGVSSRAVVEKRDREDRIGGGGEGVCYRSGGRWKTEGREGGGGRVNEEGEGKSGGEGKVGGE